MMVEKSVLRRILPASACFLICFAFYRLFAFIAFTPKSHSYFENSFTHYGGVIAGGYGAYIQKSSSTCGQAALAFFLSSTGRIETEYSVTSKMEKKSMLSLYDMEVFARSYGLKTQLLKVKPDYFRKNPAQSILHLKEKHYIVFLNDAGKYAVIFDPAYGKVYAPWNKLSKIMSGYMLYAYTS
ncbi:MAG: hypothetical protein LBJ35_03290 [Spirochaetaceae bacterium]|jgi:hypothetical protein|nr:hypothetical protein [Spirochaetaceae bacterium]